ncbi:hypothetical protein GUITHDRAFT_161960, partial [Guillardia theta CCMP2712]
MIGLLMAARVLIVPGNGCTPIASCNWYKWLHDELEKSGVSCAMKDMPDPFEAKERIWLPFMKNELGADENSIIVGHSSGAEAAMRFIEEHRVRGVVLVAACHTDLGLPSEAISGYYNRPWNWQQMRDNVKFASQFADQQDPFIPYGEAQHVHENLKTELLSSNRGDHFMVNKFPELLQHVLSKAREG